MRRTVLIALGTAAALATAAVALAVAPGGASEATATFSTSTVANLKLKECTADGQTWKFTDAHYTGLATSSEAVLNGPLEIHAKTTYNDVAKLGYVEGSFKIKDDDKFKGKFTGTLKDGKLSGYLTGKSKANHAKVLGNLSADFVGGSNFTVGQIGTSTAIAIVAAPCKPAKDPKGDKDDHGKKKHVEVKGEITGIGTAPATITVTGKKGAVTCNVGSYVIPAGFTVGTKDVEMKCDATGDPAVWTLRKLEKDS